MWQEKSHSIQLHNQRTAAALASPPPCVKRRMNRIWTVGYRRFVPVGLEFESIPWDKCPSADHPYRMSSRQRIRYLTASDGTRLAWAQAGEGPLLVKAANWL